MNQIIPRISRRFIFKLHWFLAGIVGISIVAWFFNTFSPKQGSETIILGITLLGICTWILLFSLSNNVRRISLVVFSLIAVLSLRVLKLYDPLYYISLFAFVITVDYAFKKKL